MRVLLIEDNQADIELFRYAVKNTDTEVEVSRTLEDAISRVQVKIPDIVVLDLNLLAADGHPESRGVETYKSFSERTASVDAFPVIVYTSNEERAIGRQCVELGAAAFMLKSQIADSRLWEIMDIAVRRHELLLRLRKVIAEVKGES